MISVLIPIYNYDVRAFVKQICEQFEKNGTQGEIICIDDKSTQEFKNLNQELNTYKFVKYLELSENHGRSRIRNLLASKANYEWLLFVDCDSFICEADYLKIYLNYTGLKNTLIYGGTSYARTKPEDSRLLHWKYGNERECVNASKRQKNKYGTFKTNNFFIPKALFDRTKFNETVIGYGHEDTLFAKDLERNGIEIKHIENPLQHNGLELNVAFLDKQKTAISNLATLYKKGLVGNEIRLIKFYNTAKSLRLLVLVKKLYLRDKELLKANLMSNEPKISNLDRLKLSWFLDELDS